MGSYVLLLDHWRGPPLHWYCPSHGPPTSLQAHYTLVTALPSPTPGGSGRPPAGRISKHSPQSGLTSGSLVEGWAMGPSSLTLPPLTPEGVEPGQLTGPAPASWAEKQTDYEDDDQTWNQVLNGTPGCLTWIKSPMLASSPTNLQWYEVEPDFFARRLFYLELS